ncbi:hypothetical protein [Janibacter sp. Soil728]|uniref:hypothetical protein n=1 Tax=Janibacter sp. Soil728 TaxID=1736393 RepID=UPI000AFBE48B|nr:hypothetical protein [Janibacter sp. Soil728]
MWWIIGGLALVCGGLGTVIARRGGSMEGGSDHDGHGRAVAETIGTRNDNGGAGL